MEKALDLKRGKAKNVLPEVSSETIELFEAVLSGRITLGKAFKAMGIEAKSGLHGLMAFAFIKKAYEEGKIKFVKD